jgi:glycerol-3-phosphate dehydrogenase (NAD(P)+)
MSEVVAETLGKQAMQRYVALSGPGFAMELAQGLPMATTVASRSPVAVRLAQRLLMTERYRVYTSTDVVGVELGGALKNVMAIAAGMSDGIGYGDSAKAALMTRGLVEMSRLGVAMGGRVGTFYGLSGLGDLMATCFSQKSRNRGVGERLGRGETLSQIQASMTMVAEGVHTAKAAREMAKKSTGRGGIETPIIDEINAILYKGKSPKLAVQDLMTRTARAE